MAEADTDFDPTFGVAAEKLRQAAAARGIKTHYISGRRSRQDQEELYANYQAGIHNQPLPYPERGRVPLAARPGTSLHERGLAADIVADDPDQEATLRSMAPQFGLRTIGPSDPNHFEVARGYTEQAKMTSPAVAAINSAAAPASSGATLSHEQFIRDYARQIGINPDQAVAIARAEGLNAWSKDNPNAGSYVDRTNGVPWSFGDFQLNTRNGMGVDAIKAGIDPKDPNQWQAADKFALDQMRAHGVGAWSNPVARGIAAHGGLTLTTPGAEATATAAPTAPAAPTFGEAAAKGDVGGMFKSLYTKPPPKKDAQGNETEQKSTLENVADAFGSKGGGQQQGPAPIPEMAPAPVVTDPMMGMAPAAQQLFQQVSQATAKPLSWTSEPYGSNAGLQRIRQGGGTTLNNTGYGYS